MQYLPTKNECPDCGGKGTHFPNERFPAPCLTCKGRGCLLKVKHPPLKYFKVYPSAVPPKWGTLTSACFDLAACLEGVDKVTYYDEFNKKLERSVLYTGIRIYPGDRMMIPTGLILDIPIGYSVRIHNRSGMAIKNGLVLANHEGVIDSDYVDPTFLVMLNSTQISQTITHGDRLAQGEMVPDIEYEVLEVPTAPAKKTDRAGGFGSTGVQS